jgi:hypothetical protein
MATPFPARWGRTGREGLVAEFSTGATNWVGNFEPGLSGIDLVDRHPNNRDAVVVAGGDLWCVDVARRTAECVLPAVNWAAKVQNPDGWIFSRQGLALVRFGANGLLWHTKRLSWDGFDKLECSGDEVSGLAWSVSDDRWHPFAVDAITGRSRGGSFGDDDSEGWERLAGE